MDTTIILTRTKRETGTVYLRGRDLEEQGYIFDWMPKTTTWVFNRAQNTEPITDEAVLAVLREHGALKAPQIADHLGGKAISTVKDRLNSLAERNQVLVTRATGRGSANLYNTPMSVSSTLPH